MRPQRFPLFLCGAITLILLCAAAARAERYRNPQRHYSLELPEGWQEMAAQEISTINQFAQTLSPVLSYETGFRPRNSAPGSYPYVLIQLQRAASSYDAIERSLEKEVQGAVKQIEGKLSDIAQNMRVGEARLDRTKNRVYMRVGMDVAGVGKVHGLTVGHLGSEVTVWIHANAVASDFEKMLPTFSELNDTFAFDEGYAFKPSDGTRDGLLLGTLRDVFGGAFVGVFVGVFFGVIGGGMVGILMCALALGMPRRKCPDCGEYLPRFRKSAIRRQALLGGWTCPKCGCEVDRRGRKVPGP